VHASKLEASIVEKLAPAMLAGIMAFTGVSATYAPVARADDEEFMTPYQKRQAEMERRRELLREARERAAARASGAEIDETPAIVETAKPEPAKVEPPAPSSEFASQAARVKKESLKAYEDAAKNRPAVPATPEPQEAPTPALPKFGGFNFGKPAEAPAPAPAAPVTPAPAPKPVVPVPVPVPAPAPAPLRTVEVKKEEAKKAEQKAPQSAVSKKRRGPLPLWFAEILVLGAYVGLGLAATKYSEQSGKVLKAVWAKIVGLYTTIEKFVASRTQTTA
jgi:hypothetical protein